MPGRAANWDGMMRTMCLLLSGSWDTERQPIAAAEPKARVDSESVDGFHAAAGPHDAGASRAPRDTLAA